MTTIRSGSSENIFDGPAYTRALAAQTAHEYLRDTVGEADLTDIRPAALLKDLYDCHLCVNHIAQMYLKGIIAPRAEREFGGSDILSPEELRMIAMRLADPSLRVRPETPMPDMSHALIIDVSPRSEYQRHHAAGAVNHPLSEYVLNPYAAASDLSAPIIFTCKDGHEASLAAESAKKAGYVNAIACSWEDLSR